MLEPLGQSQVVAYLRGLSPAYDIHLISFEKARDWANESRRRETQRQLLDAGIAWWPLRYHKRPTIPATAYDVAHGVMMAVWIALRHRVRFVHARGDVASLIAFALKTIFGTKFLYDIRGFWPDERVDGGLWRADSALYRVAKAFEKQFRVSADHKVVLSRAAASELRRVPYLRNRADSITVIPTCTDLTRFQPLPGRDAVFTLGYVGSVSTWYLFDEVLRFFMRIRMRVPEARMLIINRGEHARILGAAAALRLDTACLELKEVEHAEVPKEVARMHAGVFFYRSGRARFSFCPTKLGEFLACGVPCISNAGIGDVADILEGEKVGIAVYEFDDAALDAAGARLLAMLAEPGLRDRCVASARRHFSLEDGVRAYAAVYEQLSA